jgi:hypothetical protein
MGRARRRGEALDSGAVRAGRQQGATGENQWGPEVAPGRQSGGGLTLAVARRAGPEQRCRRKGGGRHRGRGGSDEWRGGPMAQGGGEGGGLRRRG